MIARPTGRSVPSAAPAWQDQDGALRSWRLDGTRGPLQISGAHDSWIAALVVVEHDGAPLIVSGDKDGALRSWRLAELNGLAVLQHPAARDVEVRELSLGSLDALLHLPPDVLATGALAAAGVVVLKLAKVLDAVKRVAGFRAELRIQDREQLAQDREQLARRLRADAAVLEAEDALAEATALHRRAPAARCGLGVRGGRPQLR